MAVAFSQNLLATEPTSNVGAATSIVATTTAVVASKSLIIAVAGTRTTNVPTVLTLSGGSLAWHTAILAGQGTVPCSVGIAAAYAPAGLASSTAITATWDATTGKQALALYEFTGASASVMPDKTASLTNASGANTTGATATTGINDEFAIGAWAYNGASAETGTVGTDTGTATGGTVTKILDALVGASAWLYVAAEYQVLTGAGTVNFNFTPGTAAANAAVVATFQGSGVPPIRSGPAFLGVRSAVQSAATY